MCPLNGVWTVLVAVSPCFIAGTSLIGIATPLLRQSDKGGIISCAWCRAKSLHGDTIINGEEDLFIIFREIRRIFVPV